MSASSRAATAEPTTLYWPGYAIEATALGAFMVSAAICATALHDPSSGLARAIGLDFWLTSEDLPDPDNRVTLDRDGNIVLAYAPNNTSGHERLSRKLKYRIEHLDGGSQIVPHNLFVGSRIPVAGSAHQNG